MEVGSEGRQVCVLAVHSALATKASAVLSLGRGRVGQVASGWVKPSREKFDNTNKQTNKQ